MRVLFGTTPLEGHFRPLVPLARALEARGHEVAFATHRSWHAHVAAAGFAAFDAGVDHVAARGSGWDAIVADVAALPPLERRPYAFAVLFGEGHAPPKLPHLLEHVRRWRPDVLVLSLIHISEPTRPY